MRRRASRPGRAPHPASERFDAAEVLGMLLDATGTPEEGRINRVVSDVLMHDEELSSGMLRLVQTMRDIGAVPEDEAWHDGRASLRARGGEE